MQHKEPLVFTIYLKVRKVGTAQISQGRKFWSLAPLQRRPCAILSPTKPDGVDLWNTFSLEDLNGRAELYGSKMFLRNPGLKPFKALNNDITNALN